VDILGISCFYHDSAAALIRDGAILAAAEEERFSRKKHDNGFPESAIDFCLRQAGIRGDDLDYVVFYEKPLVKFERILMSNLATFPRSQSNFRDAMIAWMKEKLWVKNLILRKLNLPADRLLFSDHHMSHATSAFFMSPFTDAAIMTVDGVGEWTTATIGRGTATWDGTERNSIELLYEQRFPHSLGLLYSAFTAFLGFKVNNGEYKVMGMAPYGEPHYVDEVYKTIRVGDDGSFSLDMDYFSFHYSPTRSFSDKFVQLFGEPRAPESEFYTKRTGQDLARQDPHGAERNQHYADIAASIQRVTEEVVLKMARHAHQLTGSPNLCMAGGVALNSVANGRLLRESPFENIFIQPAAGDSGGALGAALWAYHILLQKPRSFVQEHNFWGAGYSAAEIRQFLDKNGISYQYYDDNVDEMLDVLTEDILAGRVIAWYQGRFEWGPRALGNRSIIADPRRAEMKDIVNTKIKFREPFRPFAPVVLEERTAEYYDTGDVAAQYPPRYMLMVYNVHDDKRDVVPATTHEGGTSRIQTIRREWNPLYYDIVERFGQATGVSVLMNTSFNLRGEPIVNTPANAWNTFSNSGIDVLMLDRFVIRKDGKGAL